MASVKPQYLLMQRYIESLSQMAQGNNSKVVFMPVETSAMLSSIGTFKEIFAETGQDSGKRPDKVLLPDRQP